MKRIWTSSCLNPEASVSKRLRNRRIVSVDEKKFAHQKYVIQLQPFCCKIFQIASEESGD